MKIFIKDLFKSVCKHHVFSLAAQISYFSILALVPITMIFVSVMGYVLGTGEIVAQITDTLANIVPGATDVFITNIENLINNKSSLGWWGVFFLFLVSTVLFGSIEVAFDTIFDVKKSRHFLYSRLISIGIIFIIILLFFVPATMSIIEKFLIQYGYSVPGITIFTKKYFYFVFVVFGFVITLVLVTNHRVLVRYAFIGGVIFGVSITIAKLIFQWYIGLEFTKYDIIYGSLTAIILTAIWIYYVAVILLMSAEIVACLHRRLKKHV